MIQARIATGGKAGAGKDFILNILAQYHAGRAGQSAIYVTGFGELVRTDWKDINQDLEPTRRELQIHGQWRRQQDEHFWTKRAVEWADSLSDDVVIGLSGVRFRNEVDVLQRGGFLVGLVEAPTKARLARLQARDHRPWTLEELEDVTETSLDEIPRSAWDFVVWNG